MLADEVICTPLFTDSDVVAFLTKKKSLEAYEEVDTILVLEPIRSAEPMVLNDPVTTKLPDIIALPVNGNGFEATLGAHDADNAWVAYDAVPNNEPVNEPLNDPLNDPVFDKN